MNGSLEAIVAKTLKKAEKAGKTGEVPVAAALFDPVSFEIVALEENRVERKTDQTEHAEIRALKKAFRIFKKKRLDFLSMYVTLEPCPMCAQAISAARIRRLYFGAYDPKSGGVDHGARIFSHASAHHKPDVIGGIGERESKALLRVFFKALRED